MLYLCICRTEGNDAFPVRQTNQTTSIMKNQELLRQAFDEGKWPKAVTYCFQKECPKKDDCLHFLYGQCKPTEAKSGLSVFPDALHDGECDYYVRLRMARKAWGFDGLFAEVKLKDAPTLRQQMRRILGSKGQYYRYKLGQLKLLPEQQEQVRQLFAAMGYADVSFDHFVDELDLTKS